MRDCEAAEYQSYLCSAPVGSKLGSAVSCSSLRIVRCADPLLRGCNPKKVWARASEVLHDLRSAKARGIRAERMKMTQGCNAARPLHLFILQVKTAASLTCTQSTLPRPLPYLNKVT